MALRVPPRRRAARGCGGGGSRLRRRSDSERVQRRRSRVEALERLGAEVLVARADVTDLVAMQAAVDAAVARFGPIRGVIHSAGVPGGGVIQRRSREAAAAVLAPKVTGTLVLDTIFRHRDLDFFVLCSSLSSVLGGFGQADYSAANAFLDAFAHHRSARSRGLSAAINWDAWREVGMAVDAAHTRATGEARAANPASATSPYRELAHPLFDRFMRDETGAESYVTRLDGPRSWVVQEHRVQGRPTLPGTAYLELARAAFGLHMSSVQPVELRDVVFLAPLSVAAGAEPEVRTVIRRVNAGQEREFTILSRPDPKRDHWQEHARGRIAPLAEAPLVQHDVERLIRETSGVFNTSEQAAMAKQRPMEFGPRWQNLVQVRFGRNQGLAFIQLPEAFKDDLNTFVLHPALLDSATGFVAVRTPAHYLPFSYRRVRILRPLGQCAYSYAGFEQSTVGGRERLQINLTIMDTDGVVQIEIEDYVLVRVAP